jgi:glycosyltransferase involved in cell wall biosynthesis
VALRVLRVCHGGRDPQHRGRERALAGAGLDVTAIVPSYWPDEASERTLSPEPFRVIELPVRHAGDMNRHAPRDSSVLRRVIDEISPDVLDIHAEPFSVAARHWLRAAPTELPVLMYSAQNVDKRYPPPFSVYERAAHQRVVGFYPCCRQVASVLRGKGFAGVIDVLPLGYDDGLFRPGEQAIEAEELSLMIVGRLVPEKGIQDAVVSLARVHSQRPARLVVIGEGPEKERARVLATSLGVGDRVEFMPWQTGPELALRYRAAHIVLIPSRPTTRWVEQFGRVIVEAQASGAVVAGYASGSIPEVAGEAGVLVDAGDAEQLGDEVARVVMDSDEFAWRRAAGLRQTATCTWQAVAARQIGLYQAVLTDKGSRVTLARSPRQRRAAAQAEFGPTAATLAGVRPFALPVLRRGGRFADALGSVGDAANELRARFTRRA